MISCRAAFGDNKIIIKIIYNVQAKVPVPHGRSEFANLTPGYNGGNVTPAKAVQSPCAKLIY